MVKYPLLSLTQQAGLPELEAVHVLPAQYEDSTHQLWRCKSVDGPLMLKICNGHNIRQSSFWQGMSLLFDVQLPAQLGSFKAVYEIVNENSPLTIPDYIASDSDNRNKKQRAYILTKLMQGSMVSHQNVDDGMVSMLAKHISQLHQARQTAWGKLIQPVFTLNTWAERLQHTIKILAEDKRVPDRLLGEALAQAAEINPDYAVPIMPDLRWDQFLQNNGHLTTLVDLDAFVIAPREFELVLLEYLFTPAQAKVFIAEYQSHFPDAIELSQVRKSYRLLLFLMNILGERDIDAWMAAEKRF